MVELNDGADTLSYDYLVLATGAHGSKLRILRYAQDDTSRQYWREAFSVQRTPLTFVAMSLEITGNSVAGVCRMRACSDVRSTLAPVLTVVSCVVIVLATIALGVQQTLLNTDRWVAVVGPLASDPTVQSSVAQATATMALDAIDVQGRTQALPGPVRTLTAPLQSSVSTFVTDQAQQLVASPHFAQLWVGANRTIHGALVQLLRGEPSASGAVRISDGQVQVNLVMLMPALLQRMQQQAPAAILAQLPTDFGYVSIGQVSTLATLQRAVQSLDTLTLVLVVAAPVLVVVTLLVADDRRRTMMWLGIGVALGLAVAGAALVLSDVVAMASLNGQAIGGAAQVALSAMLMSIGMGMLLVFVVAVIVALLAGTRRGIATS